MSETMRKIINREAARIVELPGGQRLMPGEAFDADEKCLQNPGVKVLLSAGVLDFVSSLAPSKNAVLNAISGAGKEADLRGIAVAAELAGLHTDSEVLEAFRVRIEALREGDKAPAQPPTPAPPEPPKPPTLPAPPDTKPEKA